jgi:hypothetical protein
MTDEVGKGAESRHPSGQRRELPNSTDRRGQRGRRNDRHDTDPVTSPPAPTPVSEPAIKISLGEQVEVSTTSVYTRQKRLTAVGQATSDPSLPSADLSATPKKPELP